MTNYSFFRHVALVFSVFLISNLSSLQAQVGIGTTNLNSNAALEINGDDGGLLMPRMALVSTGSSNPLGAHVAGMTVYNTATSGSGATQVTPGFYFNDGTKWVRISGSSDPKTAWELAGNAGTNPTDNFLGTTDNEPLRIRTNNSNRFEFTTDGQIRANGNGTASAPTYSWTANNRNNSGMYSPANNQLGFSTGGGNRLLVTNDFIQSIQNHRFPNGTASNPSIAFANNTGTGFWRPEENILAASTNGTERMRVDANGRVLVNSTTNAIPGTIPNATFRMLVRATGNESAAIGAYHSGTGPGIYIDATASNNGFAALETHGKNRGIFASGDVGAQIISNDGGSIIETMDTFSYYALVVDDAALALDGWYFASDRKFKKNIYSLKKTGSNSVLDKVLQLEPVSYNWRAEEFAGLKLKPNKTMIGFIAQDVDKLFPEVVEKDKLIPDPKRKFKRGEKIEHVSGYYAVNYASMVSILTQAIQEQQAIIEGQNSKIEDLERSMNELKQLVQELLNK